MNSVHGMATCDATVDRYIGYAKEAFMLTRVKRYNVKGRKYIGTPYKIYFEDVGTVETREKDVDGKEIRVQREIDFIASLGSKKYYIQSAYAIPSQEKYIQETMSFEHTMDSFKKIIIVEKNMKPRYDVDNFLNQSIY